MTITIPDSTDVMIRILKTCEGHAPNGGYGAYTDSTGHCTIGYGQKISDHPCTPNEIAAHAHDTEQQAAAQLRQDYKGAKGWVANNIPGWSYAPGQKDSLVDLYFNMGTRMQGHDIWPDLLRGELAQVPEDIGTLKGGGPGIAERRRVEIGMWNSTYRLCHY